MWCWITLSPWLVSASSLATNVSNFLLSTIALPDGGAFCFSVFEVGLITLKMGVLECTSGVHYGLSVTGVTINNYENDQQNFTVDTLKKAF